MWWKEAIGYEIYLRSFKDSNGDGIGDLRGIIEKLDYLEFLGVNLLWICPFFKSPKDDNGYDISDYKSIDEEYGNFFDFQELLEKAHEKKMKVIIDLVINHTSDEHSWFKESRKSRYNKKKDWYIWRDKKNNWGSIFGGSAWEYCKEREQYYLHIFSKKQPDLNWENKEVRKEIYKTVNWWLDKGIDGFRVDAISHIKKEINFLDLPNESNKEYVEAYESYMNVFGIDKLLKELRENTFDNYSILTVGEANGVSVEEALKWVDEKKGSFNMIFQFEHLKLWDYEKNIVFSPKRYKKILEKWQKALDKNGWNALFIENHDIPRSVSTWGNDEKFWEKSSKSFGTAYFLLKGTPFIYQGQEIGMTNTNFKTFKEINEIKSINIYNDKIENGESEEKILKLLSKISRDNGRTPVQWSNSLNAGFTEGEPWIKVNENYKKINIKDQMENKDSILNYYRQLIDLKKREKTLIYGKFKMVLSDDEDIFSYIRKDESKEYLILSNLSEKRKTVSISQYINKKFKILITNNHRKSIDFKKIDVKEFESFVVEILE